MSEKTPQSMEEFINENGKFLPLPANKTITVFYEDGTKENVDTLALVMHADTDKKHLVFTRNEIDISAGWTHTMYFARCELINWKLFVFFNLEDEEYNELYQWTKKMMDKE